MALPSPEDLKVSPAQGRPLVRRLLAAGALLLGEYLLISFLFDAQSLQANGDLLSGLHYVGDLGSIALVATAAALALMGPTLRRALSGLSPRSGSEGNPWPLAAVHAAAYSLFLLVTRHVFAGDPGVRPGLGWGIGWLLSGLVVFGTWLPLALPWRAFSQLRRVFAAALGVGVAAGMAAWVGGELSSVGWHKMASITLSAVAAVLRPIVDDVLVRPAALTIGTAHFAVQVAPICSGFEGIGLIVVLLSGYMLIERRHLRFPRTLALLPIAVITVWMANIVRIAALILVGTYLSPQLAIGGFHSKAGWLLFSAVALGFVAIARNARYFASEGDTANQGHTNSATAYLLPLLTLLATGLATGLLNIGFDWLYPVRAACVLAVLFALRSRYRELPLGLHWQSVGIGVAVFGLWYLLAAGGDEAAVRDLRQGLRMLGPVRAGVWLAGRALGACVVVPIAEELAFRGYLLRRLMRADFTEADPRRIAWVAWVVSSLGFGILHADWLAGTCAGLAYALAQQRRGRVTDAIAAHAVTNLLLAADALLFGHLRWWA